jgi:AGCS family alanine or glycine:cation symporter
LFWQDAFVEWIVERLHIIEEKLLLYGGFMNRLLLFVTTLQEYLWSFPMLFLLFGTHIYFTVRLRFIQRRIPEGIRLSFSGKEGNTEGLSPYAALATALAATIGTGNIVGVSAAIVIGGPGAVFWCWITGVLGIATCYAECFLAVKYRIRNEEGNYQGGPMYVLERALKQKGLAVTFAVCTIIASFGIGSSVQAHSMASAVTAYIGISPHLIGMAAGVLAGVVIIGGQTAISKVCTWLVPVMSIFFLGGCLFLLIRNRAVLPETVKLILTSAFSFRSVGGGMAGSALMTGIRTGISRGLFTNEAGLGSIPMTAASAGNHSPEKQGLISMTGPFWDTVVMCAVTGIAFVSCMVKNPSAYAGMSGEKLCFAAFSELPFYGEQMLAVSLVLFSFATMIGWHFYGDCAVRYLWGEKAVRIYQFLYMISAYLGAVVSMELVWGMADLFNSFMAVPNIIGLWMLRDRVMNKK